MTGEEEVCEPRKGSGAIWVSNGIIFSSVGTRIRFLGWYRPGIGHPLFSHPPFHEGNIIGHSPGGRDRRDSPELRCGRRKRSIDLESLWEGPGGILAGRSASRMVESPRLAAVTGSCQRFTALWRNHSSRRGCRTGVGSTSRRCGGSFAKQVAGNIENGEAPTLLREHLGIRLDENLDGLFAGINLDTNRRVAKVDLVPSSVLSSNDGVGHYRLAFQGSAAISDHFRSVQAPKAEQLWSGTVLNVGNR
jgi:hypothetical protein